MKKLLLTNINFLLANKIVFIVNLEAKLMSKKIFVFANCYLDLQDQNFFDKKITLLASLKRWKRV